MQSRPILFYAVLLVVLLTLFVVLQPNFSSLLFPSRREKVLDTFIQTVQTENKLDSQKFWQFRQQYAPGFFLFNPQAAEVSGVLNLKTLTSPATLLLEFRSPLIISRDYAISEESWQQAWLALTQDQKKLIYLNQTTIIFFDTQNVLRIVFIKPISEMALANGFFDYTGKEKELLKDQYWLNQTWIYGAE